MCAGIESTPKFSQPENVYTSLKSLIRSDYISDKALLAIKELCLYGLGEIEAPRHYETDVIPFKPASELNRSKDT